MADIEKIQQTEDLVDKKKADAEQVYNQANDVSGDSWADELMSDDVRKQPQAPKKVQPTPKGTGDAWADAMMSDDVRNVKQPVNVEQPVEQNTQPAPVQQVENVDNNQYKGEDLGQITVTYDKSTNKQSTSVERPAAQPQSLVDYTKAPEWRGEPDSWRYTRTIKTYDEGHPLAQAARQAKQYGSLLSADELSAVYANKDWDDLNRQSQELMRNNPTRPKGGTPQFEHDAQLLSAIHNQMVALEYNFADRNDMYRNIGQKNYRMFLEPMRKGNKYTEFYENLYNSGANLRKSNPLLLDLPDKVEAQKAADEKAGKKKPDNYYFNMALKDKDFKERYHAWSFFGSIQDNMGWNEYKNLGAKVSDLREERYKEESAKRFAESSLYAPVSALLDNSVAQAVMAVGNAYDVIKGQPLRSESVNDLLQRSMKYAGEGKNVTRGVLSFIPEAVSIMPVTGVAATKTVGALSKVFTFTPRAMKITTGGLSFMGFEMAKSALGSWSQGREIDWAEMAGNSAKGFLLGAGGSLISEGVAGVKPNINSTVANYAIQGAGKVAETGLFASTEMAMAYLGNDKEATWTSSLLNNGALIISMAIGHGIGNGFGFKSRIGNATIEKVRKAGYNTLANEMAKHTQAVERGAMPKGYSQAAIEEMQSMQQNMGSNGLSWSDYAEVLKPTNSKMTKPGTNSIEKVEDGKGYRIVSYDVNGVEIERSKVYDEVAVDKEFVKRQRAVEKKQEEANVKSFDLMRDSTIKAKAARSVADRINFDDGKSVYNGDGTVNEAFDGITADDVLYAYEVLSEKPSEQLSSDEARVVALFDEAVRDYGAEMPDSDAVKKTLCERYKIEESAFDAAWKADAKDRKGREAEICATYNSIMSRPYEVALNGGEAGMVDGRQVVIKSTVKTDEEGMPLDPNQRVYYDDGTGVKVTTAEHVLMEPTVEDPGTLGDRIANENLRKALEAKKEALKSVFAEIPTDVLESNLDIARTAIENGEDTDGSMRLTYIALEEEIQRRRDSGVEETIAPATEESAPIEIDADGNVIEGEESAPIEINERGEVIEPEQPIEAPKADNEIKPVAVPEAESNASNPKDKIDELLDAMGFEKKEERDEQRAFYADKNNEEQFEKDYNAFVGKKTETVDDSQQEVKAVDPLDEPMPKDEKGKVVMRKASTRRTRKYLYEDLGLSKEDADSIVDYELEKATKAQEDYAQKKKRPTIKDKGIDGDPEKLKQKLDEYEKAAQAAQDDVRYWEEVKRMVEEPVEPESKPESKPEPSAQNAGEANTVGNEVKEKWNNASKVYGKSDTMRLENGTKLNGRYVLAPSGSASASHDANNNYNQTPGFPVDSNGNTANSRDYRGNASYRQTTERHGESYNENAIQDRVVVSKDGVVLSGNGRTMAGELAARHNTDKEYIDYLREHAEDFGFTKEQVDSMEHPRVLFEVQEDLPYTAETFDMFNKGKEKVENKTESAVRLGKTTPAETISKVLEIIDQFDNIGDFNNNNQAPIDVLRELASAGVITQNEINALMENGKLSPQGKDFIENLLVGNIFASDPDAVRILSNNADVRQKVVTGLSALTSNARLGGGYSLVDEITTAIKLIANEREGNLERGSTVQAITTSFDFGEDYGSTPTEAFTNQLVITLTEMLNGKRVREFKEFLDSYNNEAEVSAGGETRMFGNLGTKEEIFNFIIDNFKNGRYKKSRDARAGAGQGEGERAGDEEAGAGPENPRADAGQGVGDGEAPLSLKDNEGSSETVTSDVRARLEEKLGKETADRIESIAKSLGVRVRFTDEDVNGFMDHEEGVLYIGKNLDSNKTEAFVAGHELTHEMQSLAEGKGSEVYDTFKKAALDWAKDHKEEGGKGYDFDWIKWKYENHFRDKYKREALDRGMSEEEANAYAEQKVKEIVTDDYVNDEIAANVAGRMLENPAVAEDLFRLREAEAPEERRNALRRILDWIKEYISKRIGNKKEEELTPEEQRLVELRDKFNDMYNEVVREDLNSQGIETAKKGDARCAVKDTLEGEERERAIEDLMEVTGRSRATVVKWLNAEQSLAKVILDGDNQKFLDLQVDESVPSIWNNSDYPQGTVEFSNICRKRLPFTVIYQRLQKEFPNRVFDASTLEDIRQIMKDNGEDVACGLCFVEDRRQLLGEIGDGFINAVKGENADINENQRKALEKLRESGDGYIPNLYELLTLDGMKKLRKDHPAVAQAFVDYNNARGMQAGRLFQAYSAYHREILNWNKAKIKSVNDAGGLRIFSFSDFEAHHLIDLVQVLTDCAAKGIKVQGYTKVPEFAKAVKDTKAKINRSLIAKGEGYVEENYVPQEGEAVSPNVIDGKRLLLDTVEGIDVNHPDFFDSTNNKNVGNILVGINDEQIRLAMLDPFVDYIIPFHSGLSEAIRAKKGIGDWENYKLTQLEKKYNESGKLVNADKHGINIYTDVLPRGEELIGRPIRNARDFQMAFFKACDEKGWVPRFSKFINTNKKGEYVYTPGYEKLLIDFKLFDKKGRLLPQEAVEPRFDNDFNKTILDKYVEGEKSKVPYDELYAKVKEGLGLGKRRTRFEDMAEQIVEDSKVRTQNKAQNSPKSKSRVKETVRYSLSGEKGAARLDEIDGKNRMKDRNIAEEMEKEGKDTRAIKLATGWERGADKKWRYETPDIKMNDDEFMKFVQHEGKAYYSSTLGELFGDNELFAAYPELRDVNIYSNRNGDNGYYPSRNEIGLDISTIWGEGMQRDYARMQELQKSRDENLAESEEKKDKFPRASELHKQWAEDDQRQINEIQDKIDWMRRVLNNALAHEVQHVIQEVEGFAKGGSPRDFGEYPDMMVVGRALLDKETADKVLDDNDTLETLREKYEERKGKDDFDSKTERGVIVEAMHYLHGGYSIEDLKEQYAKDADRLWNLYNDVGPDSALGKYEQLAGETEARNVSKRMNMSDEQRRNTPASETEDVPREEQIVREGYSGNDTQYSLKEDTAKREERRDSEESKKLFDATKEKFGTTNDFREAGYILPDGTMLDFSGRHWMNEGDDTSHLAGRRAVDHRAIYEVGYDKDENETGFKTDMSDFIERGAIRINGPSAINLSMPPTMEQVATLRRYIQGKKFMSIDFGNGENTEHGVWYGDDIHPNVRPLNGSRILADIDRYFNEGIKPKGDPVPHYSLREEGGRDYAAEMRELMRRRLRGEDVTAELEQLRADRRAAEAARSTESNGAGSGEPPAEPPTPPAPASPEPAPELPPTGYDRPMSPIEMAQEAAIKVVADTKASLEQRNTARRELDASLKSLHKAMRLQKEYDRTTVENVVGLCKMMVKSGLIDRRYISNLTPLFTKLKDSTGKEDLTSTVNGIMDVMLKSQERSIRNEIAKLLKVTGTKVDENGVVKQAGLDIRGQHTMKELSEYMDKGSRIIDNRIEKLEEMRERIGDDDTDRLNEIDDKILGCQLAKQFSEIEETHGVNISEAEGDLEYLKERYKSGEIGIKEYTEQKHALENLIRSYRMAQTDALWNQIKAINWVITDSKEGSRNWIERQKQHKGEILHNAYSDMEGTPSYTQGDTTKMQEISNSALPKFFSSSLFTLQTMLKSLGNKHAMGEGYLYNRFFKGWMEQRDAEITEYRNDMNTLNTKAKELTGHSYFGIYKMIQKLPNMTVEYYDGGEMRPHELDQGQLGYAYMVNKMEDGAAALRNMGISEEKMQEIANFLNPKLKEFYDWLQDDFLAGKWDGMNEVHKRMFGADMDRVANYIPLRRDREAGKQKVDISQESEPPLQSTVVGSIIQRVHSNLGIDLKHSNAIDVVANHLLEATHWKHFSEWKRDSNTLLSDTKFRNKVKNSTTIYGSGKILWERLNQVFQIAGGDYKPSAKASSVDKAIVDMARTVNTAKVSMRVFTATKQLLSLPVFATECNPAILLKNVAFLLSPVKISGNPAQNSFVWCMQNLPQFRERWVSRIAGETRLENGDLGWGYSRQKVLEMVGRIGLTPNAFIDACTVAAGAKSIYEKRYKQYKKDGYSEEVADKKAKIDAEVAFNESQQSSEKAFVSPIQVDRTAVALGLSTFRNASMGYERKFVDAVRNFKHLTMGGKEYKEMLVKRKEKELIEQGMDKAEARAAAEKEYKNMLGAKAYREVTMEFMKKQMERDGLTETQAKDAAERLYRRSLWRSTLNFLMFGFGAQMAWNVGGKLPYLIFGDDDEEKKKIYKQAAVHAGIGGWIEGMPAGDMLSEGMTNWAMNLIDNGNPLEGTSFFEFDPDLLTVTSDAVKVTKYLEGKNPLKGATAFVNLLGQIYTGVNPETFSDAGVAIYDACNGDPEVGNEALMCILRIMQCPQSQLDQMYIDELKMSARQAQNLTPEEVARRYAYYKAHKDTPYMWWMYNQSKKDEIVKKYEGDFTKKLNTDVKEAGGTPEDYHDLMESSTTTAGRNKYRDKEIAALSAQGPEALMKAWEKERDKGSAADYKYIKSLMTRYQKDVYGKGKTPDDAGEAYEALHGEDIKEQALKIGRDLGFGAQDSYFQMSQYKAQHTSAKDPVMKEFSENDGGFKYSKEGKFFKMDEYNYKVPVKDVAKREKALKVMKNHKEELRRNYRNGWRMAKIKALYKDIEAESLKKDRDEEKMKKNFVEIINVLEDERKDAAQWEKLHPKENSPKE